MTALTRVMTAPLHTVATIERNVVDPAQIQKGTLYVGLEHMNSDGHFVGVKTVDEGELASSKFAFSCKHVLYGKLRPYLAKIARPDFSGVCSTDILPILPGKDLDRAFLCHFLRQPRMVELAASRATGANLPRLSPKTLADFAISFPPFPEQRRIAAILDKADELRAKRRATADQLNGLTQSVFLEMFGDPVSNPKGWKTGVLGDVIYSASDGPHVSPKYVESGVPFLSTRHIRPGELVWEDLKFISREDALLHWKKCKPERGDILYTKGGTTGIAKAVDFDTDIAVWVHISLLKTNKALVEPRWLEQMLNSAYCYQQSQVLTHGIANRDLGLKRMVRIRMFIPPIDIQREFVKRADTMEMLRVAQRKSQQQSNNLFDSLQHRAFSGEL